MHKLIDKITYSIILVLVLISFLGAGSDEVDSPIKMIFIGKIIRVIDADTIVVKRSDTEGEYKIRLAYVDSPESDQPWGPECKKETETLVFRKDLKVFLFKKDLYGRWIANVNILHDKGESTLSYVLTRDGCGWCYETKDILCRYYEDSARESKKGLWNDPAPIHPKIWRKMKEIK